MNRAMKNSLRRRSDSAAAVTPAYVAPILTPDEQITKTLGILNHRLFTRPVEQAALQKAELLDKMNGNTVTYCAGWNLEKAIQSEQLAGLVIHFQQGAFFTAINLTADPEACSRDLYLRKQVICAELTKQSAAMLRYRPWEAHSSSQISNIAMSLGASALADYIAILQDDLDTTTDLMRDLESQALSEKNS